MYYVAENIDRDKLVLIFIWTPCDNYYVCTNNYLERDSRKSEWNSRAHFVCLSILIRGMLLNSWSISTWNARVYGQWRLKLVYEKILHKISNIPLENTLGILAFHLVAADCIMRAIHFDYCKRYRCNQNNSDSAHKIPLQIWWCYRNETVTLPRLEFKKGNNFREKYYTVHLDDTMIYNLKKNNLRKVFIIFYAYDPRI